MKKTISMITALLFCICAFAEYQYNGKAISDKQFEKMYESNKDRLFVDHDGNVIAVNRGENAALPEHGDVFLLSGKFIKSVDSEGGSICYCEYYHKFKKIPKNEARPLGEGMYFTVCIVNPDFKRISINQENRVPVLILRVVNDAPGRGVGYAAEMLNEISKARFSEYIKTNALPSRKDTAGPVNIREQVPCSKCYGSGTITEKRKRIDCPNCNGTGRFTK